MSRVDELVRALGLIPHREGGFFRETYRAADSICTAIYYLLPEGERSLMHRIKSDELWHYHLGGALELTQIGPDGRPETVVIGPDAAAGQKLQHAVPAGHWFGAEPARGAGYCLVGCTVAPGFDFAHFELARRDKLVETYPLAREAIVRLTEDSSCV